MDENLIGYLLKALDDDEHRQVERRLRSDPALPRRLELLTRSIEPLAADAAPAEPPADLWVRTLASVAERRSRELPRAPKTLSFADAAPRRWWRRADLFVAAAAVLIGLSLIPSSVVLLRQQRDKLQCQNNLRQLHQALMAFCDRHEQELPKVEEKPPRNFAGVFVPILHSAGTLGPDTTLGCAAAGARGVSQRTLEELDEMRRARPEEYEQYTRDSAGGYAYALGYRDADNRLIGLRRDATSDGLPVMADRPPYIESVGFCEVGNSRNHGGSGQNVLYLGGHVVFSTTRTVGVGGDDIYVNRQRKVAAGLDRLDTVLGAGAAQPSPATLPDD